MKYRQLLLLIALISPGCICANGEQKRPVSEAPRDRVNYPSNFQVENGCNLFVSGEYLFWTANEDGLYFAQTGFQNSTLDIPPNGEISFKGRLKKIDPDWENGVRVGLGLNFPKEGYDVIAYWTWFAMNSHESAHGSLLPLWAGPDFTPPVSASEAGAHFNLDLNVVDLEWGRSAWFGGHFSLRPFFGLRGALIDQALKTHFQYETTPAVTSHLHSNADFHGGGLRAGADVRFALPCGFAVYGVSSGSLLYGRLSENFRVKEEEIVIARSKDHFWKGISSLQLGLGFGWDAHFAKDRLHIEFHVGWESNIWFSVNAMNHFLNQLSTGSYFKENGNLSTQGIVAGGRFDF